MHSLKACYVNAANSTLKLKRKVEVDLNMRVVLSMIWILITVPWSSQELFSIRDEKFRNKGVADKYFVHKQLLSNNSSSNHVKCFKSRHLRVLSNMRELFRLWIRQSIEQPRMIIISISKRAKPGWRDLGYLINWHQIFKTSLNDRNGDNRGHAACSCVLL